MEFTNFNGEVIFTKTKRNTFIQEYGYGDSNVIDLTEFSSALKSSWIRRIIFANTNDKNFLF